MSTSNEKHLDERHRLLEIREYLHVHALPQEAEFESQVVEACAKKVRPIINANSHRTGEEIVAAVAQDLGVHFEDVKTPADITRLEKKYLVEQKELGFGLLAKELSDPTVDALLFQRMKASGQDPDRWVAVINLQETEARAYWSRPHELVHRLAEPPQRRLPFFRHRTDHGNRVERLIDLGVAELAFPKSIFGKLVQSVSHRDLTWELVKSIRQQFSPTASLQSAAKAVVNQWPHPAFLLVAKIRGRRRDYRSDVALRIEISGFSPSGSTSSVLFFDNMRVPKTSPIAWAHASGQISEEFENLAGWTTSSGRALPSRRAFTSGARLGDVVYGLVSLA